MSAPELTVTIDPTSATPPYEQLRSQIAAQVAAGELSPGTRLPTVRQLGLDLGLAANTVARSYRELEADGVLETQGRRGTFVPSHHLHRATSDDLSRLAAELVTSARRAGLTLAETEQLIRGAWARG